MEPAVRTLFRTWADGWAQMRSPLMGALGRALADVLDETTETGRRVLGWTGDPKADAVPIRITGGLNAIRRTGDSPALAALYPPNSLPSQAEIERVLAEILPQIDAELATWLDAAPQTNEVGRAAVIYPALMLIAARTGLPLRLFELGASAGLNLHLDRFAYDFGGTRAGEKYGAVWLAPDWSGAAPVIAPVEIASRSGVDINPLDVSDPAVRKRLMAYCWPDQPERVARLEAALDLAARHPIRLDAADAADWVDAHISPQKDRATIVFHTIAFQYFPEDSKRRITAHMERQGHAATAGAPLFWLRFEDEYEDGRIAPTLRLKSWPGGRDEHLADAHPHGTKISWHHMPAS
ncbi:MAG: DUF2332 family protein [Pseudomonadota bacterium]